MKNTNSTESPEDTQHAKDATTIKAWGSHGCHLGCLKSFITSSFFLNFSELTWLLTFISKAMSSLLLFLSISYLAAFVARPLSMISRKQNNLGTLILWFYRKVTKYDKWIFANESWTYKCGKKCKLCFSASQERRSLSVCLILLRYILQNFCIYILKV